MTFMLKDKIEINVDTDIETEKGGKTSSEKQS